MSPRICPLLSRFFSEQKGAALIEMTLIVPFVLTLSAGVFEFSNLLYRRLLVEGGVTDAARYVARCSDDVATCNSRAINLAVNGVVSGGTARVSGWSSADISISYLSTPAVAEDGTLNYRSNAADVLVAHVTATYSYAGSGLLSFLGFGPLTLSLSHDERVIGW